MYYPVVRMRLFEDEERILSQHPKAVALAKKGFFVRIAEADVLICPQAHVLRKKSDKRNGFTRYCNKLACKQCKEKCCTQAHKEVDMSPRKQVMPTPMKRQQLREAHLMVPIYLPK